jgi:hypothetical protein
MHATPASMLMIARDLREADRRSAREARVAADRAAQRQTAGNPAGAGVSLRRLLVAAGTIVALTAALTVSVPSVLASTRHTLTIVKDCSGTMTGKVGEFCAITSSNVPAIPKGTRVVYSGPVLGSAVFLSSTATITVSSANTATGYCMVDLHTGVGMCTFWKGTGTLAGFHAVIHGSYESATAYHWDGFYYSSGK